MSTPEEFAEVILKSDASDFVRLEVIETFVFLQSFRATIISFLAVPVSLIVTLGAFVILDFTINTLTLFAMVLAIGLVVDDSNFNGLVGIYRADFDASPVRHDFKA